MSTTLTIATPELGPTWAWVATTAVSLLVLCVTSWLGWVAVEIRRTTKAISDRMDRVEDRVGKVDRASVERDHRIELMVSERFAQVRGMLEGGALRDHARGGKP